MLAHLAPSRTASAVVVAFTARRVAPSSGGGGTRWGAPLRAGRLPRSRLPGDRAAHPTDQVCPLVAGIAQSRRAESREEVGNDYRQ